MKRASSAGRLTALSGAFAARTRLLVTALVVTAVGALAGTAFLTPPPADETTQVLSATEPAEPVTVPATSADEDRDDTGDDADAANDVALSALRTIEVHVERDPFEPVRPERTVEDRDPSDPADPADPADPSAPDDDDDRPVPPPAGNGTTDGQCVDQGELVCGGQVVEVQSTTDSTATITVGGTSYTVNVGERFAEDFILTNIDATGCAIIDYRGQSVRGCPGAPGALK